MKHWSLACNLVGRLSNNGSHYEHYSENKAKWSFRPKSKLHVWSFLFALLNLYQIHSKSVVCWFAIQISKTQSLQDQLCFWPVRIKSQKLILNFSWPSPCFCGRDFNMYLALFSMKFFFHAWHGKELFYKMLYGFNKTFACNFHHYETEPDIMNDFHHCYNWCFLSTTFLFSNVEIKGLRCG